MKSALDFVALLLQELHIGTLARTAFVYYGFLKWHQHALRLV